jgi:GT2 family glycosyltransferase
METWIQDYGNPNHFRGPSTRGVENVEEDCPGSDLDGLVAAPDVDSGQTLNGSSSSPVSDRPDISIIIVNHYADRILDDCIRAAVSGSSLLRREIIVVDNPAVAAPRSIPGCSGTAVQRIPTTDRLGFGAACNLGAKYAAGEHLLFLNPDVVVEPNAIEHLHSAIETTADAGAVIGRLTLSDGTFYPSCRMFPTITNLLYSHGSVLHWLFGSRRGRYMLPDFDDITEVDWGAAALMMVRRDLFERSSGFDERFFMYLEDTDLCFRFQKAGFRNYYIPRAGGVHLWGYSTRRYPFRRILWHHRSIWRYFVKHDNSPPTLAILAPILTGNCLLSLFFELFTLRR